MLRRPILLASFALLAATVLPQTVSAQRGPGVYAVVPRDTSWRPFFTGYGTRHEVVMRGGRVRERAYPIIDTVYLRSPADSVGLRKGDEIVAINGYDAALRPDSARYLGAGHRAHLRVRRGDSVFTVFLTPTALPRRSSAP